MRKSILIITMVIICILSNFEVKANNYNALMTEIPNELKYGRKIISDEEKILYDSICKTIKNKETDYTVPYNISIKKETFEKVSYLVWVDNPQYFWFSMYNSGYYLISKKTQDGLIITGAKFIYDDVEQFKIDRVNEITNDIMSKIQPYMNDTEKLRIVYDWVIKNTEYDYETGKNIEKIVVEGKTEYFNLINMESTNIYGILVNKKGICDGYARTILYLAQRCGILCKLSFGSRTENGVGHAWNKVYIDNEWSKVDATQGLKEPDKFFKTEEKEIIYIYPYSKQSNYLSNISTVNFLCA